MNISDLINLIKENKPKEFIRKVKLSLASSTPIDLTERDPEYECNLLDWAAIHDRTDIVSYLCDQEGIDLLRPVSGKRTAIHYAARHGSSRSLALLLEHARSKKKLLSHKDQNDETALDLAIRYEAADCARFLINHGAALPVKLQSLTLLVELIKSFEGFLHCSPDGTYQLLKEDEIDIIEPFAELSLTGQRRPQRPLPFSLEAGEPLFLCLIDKYLYLCHRVHKEKREKMLGSPSAALEAQLSSSKAKRQSLLTILRLFARAIDSPDLDWDELKDDDTAEAELQAFIKRQQKKQERYFGDDLSDNSDSDDERTYLDAVAKGNIELASKKKKYRQIEKLQTPHFWLKAQLDTPRNAGLKKKVTGVVSEIKKGMKKEAQLKKLKGFVTNTLNKDLQSRGEITYSDRKEQKEAKALIAEINAAAPEDREALIKRSKPILILGTRGINYMTDRWNAKARRYHRDVEEAGQPQFSEAVLKTLPYDYYTELGPDHDYHTDRAAMLDLQQEALRLDTFFQSLHASGPCIDRSASRGDNPYLFDSVGDCLQDHFSNGVDNHLAELAEKREDYPDYWGTKLKNAFNTGLAIGSRPYHALKYALGLKVYYPRSMVPRYWCDGTLEYPHVGKVYLSLHPLAEILAKSGQNNLSMMDRWAQVSIGDQISPEKELSFLAFLPGDRIFYQFVAKFPSFNGAWKNIYKIKYGLDRNTYEAFQYLISITLPETPFRNDVITLLSEWLCSYHEVLLIELARDQAKSCGAILAYVDRDGKLTLTPDNGRIFTPGEPNIELRNEVHTLRELRARLATKLSKIKKGKDTDSIPGFTLIDQEKIKSLLTPLLTDKEFLNGITEKTILPQAEESRRIVKGEPSEKKWLRDYGSTCARDFIRQRRQPPVRFSTWTKQVTPLSHQHHLYTDVEMDALLEQLIEDDTVATFAAMHPLVQGDIGRSSRQLFVDALRRMFDLNRTAIMPIEVSTDELDEAAYARVVGNHWNGLVLQPLEGGDDEEKRFRIEVIDPAISPAVDTDLTALTEEQIREVHGDAMAELVLLLRRAVRGNDNPVELQIVLLATRQQEGDLDCGAWTVDNLVRRAHDQVLRTRTEITGAQLRLEHERAYESGGVGLGMARR